LAVILAFALGGSPQQPTVNLASNSVGFIDARTGRLTRSITVGRDPSALTVADNSVWVANRQEATVTRIDRTSGQPVTIPVAGHPTGLVASDNMVWVWTLEGLLVPIDPRFDTAGKPVSLASEIIGRRRGGGRLTVGGGFLWIAAPGATVIRVDLTN